MIEPILRSAVVAADQSSVEGKKFKDATQQFEAILLGQILKSAHESTQTGLLGDGEQDSSSAVMEFAQEHLAQVLASQGGIGLAQRLESLNPAARLKGANSESAPVGPPGNTRQTEPASPARAYSSAVR